jgi:hypothetical protein
LVSDFGPALMLSSLGLLRFLVDEQDLTPYPCLAVLILVNLDSRSYTVFDRDGLGLTVVRYFHKTPSLVG